MASTKQQLSKTETILLRKKHIGEACQLFYQKDPIKIVRAKGQYMYDENGIRYLDCINNVAHVGHCDETVVKACTDQMAVLNTNIRFLHDNLVICAKKLTDKMPKPLSVCFFVNSGSEANDLALRLATAHTNAKDVICVDRAYHGNSIILMDISPYKYEEGKFPKKDWVHVAPIPDAYRGKYRGDNEDLGEKYANEIKPLIEDVKDSGRGLAAFIAESAACCGGQIIFPPNYLKNVYKLIRKAGGVCIADEVQVGFGRLGKYWWGFESQEVVPDIVTVGKAMGNGFPVAAVITTNVIAQSFKNLGIAFFNSIWYNFFHKKDSSEEVEKFMFMRSSEKLVELSFCLELYFLINAFQDLLSLAPPEVTYKSVLQRKYPKAGNKWINFGGNPVSCAASLAVIEVLERDNLIENASRVGSYMIRGLNKLSAKHDIIGDIRGSGFFIGIELVKNKRTKTPATEETQKILSRLKEEHVLLSCDGPRRNVLKFKPPMVFGKEDADFLLHKLDLIFQEIKEQVITNGTT